MNDIFSGLEYKSNEDLVREIQIIMDELHTRGCKVKFEHRQVIIIFDPEEERNE